MARKTKDEQWREKFDQHLEGDEQLVHVAYGVKQLPMALLILFVLIATVPGLLIFFFTTKHYLVALTNRRVLVMRVTTSFKYKDLTSYDLGQPGGEVTSSSGMIFTHLKIDNPEKPFKAKFHRAASKENKTSAEAIIAALQGDYLTQQSIGSGQEESF
ncbi:MAG: hypothetical protein H6581_01745 [Bacteroidia bacterium]|nr:hypothetical protein [Bacteroidia bacterium]